MRRLRQRFGERLVVVGIHTPKFPHEAEMPALERAVERLRIDWPVIQDRDLLLWRAYAVRAWPTTVFLDQAGRIVAEARGEIDAAEWAELVDEILDAPVSVEEEGDEGSKIGPETGSRAIRFDRLTYPTALCPSQGANRFWVAATGDHQLVEIELLPTATISMPGDDGVISARVLRRIGLGQPGWSDGGADAGVAAQLDGPRGLALDLDARRLFIADTGNHALRSLDLESGELSTIDRGSRSGELRSPWALALDAQGHRLFVAVAGRHQIWLYDSSSGERLGQIGAGAEGLRDGDASSACFAQPSALAWDDDHRQLFVADAESSAIRRVVFGPEVAVSTIAGQDLFAFGHRDGPAASALLQHPGALAWRSPELWIVDTYNSALRFWRHDEDCLETFETDSKWLEPEGITAWEGERSEGFRWFIVDAGRHRLVVVDPRTARSWDVALVI